MIFHDFLWELSATQTRENDKTIKDTINVTFDVAEIFTRGKLGLSLTTCVLRCTFQKPRWLLRFRTNGKHPEDGFTEGEGFRRSTDSQSRFADEINIMGLDFRAVEL